MGEEQVLKTSNLKETSSSNEWRDLARQLEKIFSDKLSQEGFSDQQRILGIIKELVKELNNNENTSNATRTFR